MNKLNPGAFAFVPGGSYRTPNQDTKPPQMPVERSEQIEAPLPPPTISLHIGAPKHVTPTPVSTSDVHPTVKQTAPPKAVPKPTASGNKSEPSSKTLPTEKSKTEVTDVALEVQAVADRAVLEDLYGDGLFTFPLLYDRSITISFPQSKSISTSFSSAMLTLGKAPSVGISST
jgi:peptide chain release factor subunit 3